MIDVKNNSKVIQSLNTLKTVYETGSQARAAELLNQNQSTISRNLKEIDSLYGDGVLFVRESDESSSLKQKIVLTELGHAVIGGVSHINSLIKGLSPQSVESKLKGTFKIYAPRYVYDLVGKTLLDCLEKYYPEVKWNLEAMKVVGMSSKWNQRDFKFAIYPDLYENTPDNIYKEQVYQSSRSFLVRRGHPLLYNGWKIGIDSIKKYPLIRSNVDSVMTDGGSVFDKEKELIGLDYSDYSALLPSIGMFDHRLQGDAILHSISDIKNCYDMVELNNLDVGLAHGMKLLSSFTNMYIYCKDEDANHEWRRFVSEFKARIFSDGASCC